VGGHLHGARQLDGAPATLRVLPEIVAAVGDRAEILMHSDIRRGSDIIKAFCRGARALEILRDNMERTLKLLVCSSMSELNRSYVDVPESWSQR
jgi:L-lactate dehydrogenase (cytochrome)